MKSYICLLKTLLPLLLMCSFQKSKAQFADGSGTGLYQKQIFWLGWQSSSLISKPALASDSNIVASTTPYVWQISPSIRVEAIVSNLTTAVSPSSGSTTMTLTPYVSGTYAFGDGLNKLYPNVGTVVPSSGMSNIGLATSRDGLAVYPGASVAGGVIQFDISLSLKLLINGVWTSVNYPGIVIADAESMSSGAGVVEYISAHTNGSAVWQLLDLRNDAGTADTSYKLDISGSGADFKMYLTAPASNIKMQPVFYANGATTLTNIQMKGRGVTALAVGFMTPFDFGDAPVSYGNAGNFIDNFNFTAPLTSTTTATYMVSTLTKSTFTPQAKLYIGSNNVDADGTPPNSANADADDLNDADDEDATLPASIKVNQSGNVVINVNTTNGETSAATLYGWIDFNRDGKFSADEMATASVPASTGSTARTLTFTNSSFTSNIQSGVTYIRLRTTTSNIVDSASTTGVDERSYTAAADGETEDYIYTIAGITISGTVYHDANGLSDAAVNGTGIGSAGATPLFAYLVNSLGVIIDKVAVDPITGAYSFSNVNNGIYTVAISTNDVVLGSNISTVPANLPSGWVLTGEDYGANNVAGSGVESGSPNAQIAVTTPFGSGDVTVVNFGMEQLPNSDDQTYIISTPTGGTYLTLNGTGTVASPGKLTGTDPEDGTLAGGLGSSVLINTLPTNGNQLWYNGVQITVAGTTIPNYNPALLSIKFTGVGATSTSFTYSYIDAAGKVDPTPATYGISWATPLPVLLTKFSVNMDNCSSIISWTSGVESDLANYEVVYSTNGSTWQTVGKIPARGNGSNYEFRYQPSNGKSYYRLKMIDSHDGNTMYSTTITIESQCGIENSPIVIYPNPAKDNIHVVSTETNNGSYTLVNTFGKVVLQGTLMAESNQIDLSNVTTGVYVMKVQTTEAFIIQQIQIVK
jgi:hypothetical protein